MEKIKLLELTDKSLFEKYISYQPQYASMEADFCGVYEWSIFDSVMLIDRGDYITTFRQYGNKNIFFPPIAKPDVDYDWVVSDLFKRATVSNPQISLMPDFLLNQLNKQKYKIIDCRNDYDYLYSAAEHISLEGKKYHSKRNFINRFTLQNQYVFRDYQKSDFDALIKLYADWQEQNADPIHSRFERAAFSKAFHNFFELGYKCGVIEIEGVIRAACVVSVSVNNVGQVHFEKADRSYDGIYPAVYNFTAKKYLAQCELINRQDDLGLEGLRKSKLSYNPIKLISKSEIFAL